MAAYSTALARATPLCDRGYDKRVLILDFILHVSAKLRPFHPMRLLVGIALRRTE